MPFPLYSDYFYPAFPSMPFDRTLIPPWFLEHYFMHNVFRQGRDIKRNHLNSLTRSRALLVDCFTNTTPIFFVNPHYQDQWKRFHLVSNNATVIPEVVNLLYEMVMYPRQPLCTIIEDHQMTLLKRFVIGVQVRIGGQQARYKDRQFLMMDDLPSFYDVIDGVMVNRTLTLDDVFIFLSTDNPLVIQSFRKLYGDSLQTTTEFEIGHSAPKKNMGPDSVAATHMKRAIVDLLVLQRSDVLITTLESSYGALAAALQRNRLSPVDTQLFVNRNGETDCNVFERSNRSYSQFIIYPK